MSFGSFLLRRLLSGSLAILGVSLLVFLALHLVPGDPVDHLAGGDATPEQREKIEQCMGLDRPLHHQFVAFLGNVVDGSLGPQCPDSKGKPNVRQRIFEVMPHTIALAVAGMVIALLLALPLGIFAALRRGSWFDTFATVVALSGMAMPTMLMAPLFLMVFFVHFGWLPGPTETGLAALLLPAVCVGTHLMAMLARMTRSAMIDVLGEDYIRTARAKGLSESAITFRHALRNALLPVITIAGLQFGSLLSGAIIIEKVFARPGLGTTLLDAISERNYPVVQGTVLVVAGIYVMVNIAVDVAYGLVDPRIPARMSRGQRLSPSAWIGMVMLGTFVLLGVLGPWIAPFSPTLGDSDHRFAPMSADHWLGTDKSGIDTLSQLLWGARDALAICLQVVGASALIGVTLGTIAGYFGGWVDELLMRIVDVLMAFPGILLNLMIVATVAHPGTATLVFALVINGWVGYARVARGQVLSLRERDYVMAARAVGASDARIMFHHIVPNLRDTVMIQMTFGFGGVILVEAALSFLGLGPQVDYHWGAMLDQGTAFLWRDGFVHYVMVPGLAIMWVVLGANLLGDGLRDRFDPRSRGRR